MRAISHPIQFLWDSGGPFIGTDGRPHGRVTVELGWELRTSGSAGGYPKLPVRWFQRAANDQTETEIPNVSSISMERSVDTDAATCNIVIFNQKVNDYGTETADGEFGNPGYYSFGRGASSEATARWGHTQNEWYNALTPNALIRTYQGYGGNAKTIPQAVTDGNLVLTGVWLVDEVRILATGTIEIRCRDMAKLVIEQQIYPPLVPAGPYPPHYCKYYQWSQFTGYVAYGNAAGRTKFILGIEADLEGDGYWLEGTDGGIFTYGNTAFYGSLGAQIGLSTPAVGLARTASGNGYWLAISTGNVFAFGDADGTIWNSFTPSGSIVAIERAGPLNGYWLVSDNGTVYAFGAVTNYGGVPGPAIVAMASRPTGLGYWLVAANGAVYSYGDATYYGGANGIPLNQPITAITSTPSGNGYYLAGKDGGVFAFGDAVYAGGTTGLTLNDPVSDIVARPTGGYWLVAEDGGVFAFGGAPFYGALPGPSSNTFTTPGNYEDYSDIIRDLLLWSGWWLNDDGANAHVYGNIENTGVWAEECIPDDVFDKRPVIDAINKLKEIVGFLFWVDEEGAAHFETPNFYAPGNFLPNGAHTAVIPEIDEGRQLTDYSVSFSDRTLRSQIIISSELPTEDYKSTITTIYTPAANTIGLRGLVRPAMWVNGVFTSEAEQRIMAELIALHTWFQQRLGSVSCAANPILQINDQVRIYERQTDETYIHYIRSMSTSMDLEKGEYLMSLTTHWLGDGNDWAVDSTRARGELTVRRGS